MFREGRFIRNTTLTLGFLLVLLVTGCTIEGDVLMNGQPVVGQTVWLEGEGLRLSTQTDDEGHYRFSRIDAGYYRVSLAAQGMTARRVEKLTNKGSMTHIDFSIDTETRRTIESGTLLGHIESNGVQVWKGIPFAKPPVTEFRWKAARPAEAWQSEYWALNFSEPCAQLAHLQLDFPIGKIGTVAGREDCLYLNVWAPDQALTPTGPDARPVMFWIHGGGNTAGEAAIFDGKMLAEKYGVIVVTTHYRLGVFGYLSHPALRSDASNELDKSPNFAISDLIQALHWVQRNIAAFGGDPARVMIFGESAGASNVAALLASPKATGLFHRAAMQSGGFGWSTQAAAENLIDQGGSSASSQEIISQLLVADGTAKNKDDAQAIQANWSNQQHLVYMRGKTPEDWLAHFDGSRFGMYPYPALIRDDILIPDSDPYALFQQGNFNQVPIITGTNRDEAKIFMAFNPEFVPGGLPVFIKNPNDFNLTAYYQSAAWRARAVDEFSRAISNQPVPVYTYRFDWDEEPKILWNNVAELIGASHFFEIPFVFNTPDVFTVAKASSLVFPSSGAASRQILSDSMSSYWAAFAYNGDPGRGLNQSEDIVWSPWTDEPGTKNMILFDTLSDGGIKMADDKLSLVTLKSQLQQESGFSAEKRKCAAYQQTFSQDQWFGQYCSSTNSGLIRREPEQKERFAR